MERLKGKAIIVAGAGAIGSELARRYAQEGAAVLLGDIDLDSAAAVVDGIVSGGGRALAVRLDGADEASVVDAVARCRDSFGGVDGLHVNFAKFEDGAGDIGVIELPLDTFDAVMRVNVRGFLLCTRHALPAIIARGGGSIVFTSSVAAYRGEDKRVAYAMSKASILALMRHVAARHGKDGVRANAIAPGVIKRPDQGHVFTPELMAWATSIAQIKARVGNPGDIAAIGALLMSDEGSFITGQTISVDGGISMRP